MSVTDEREKEKTLHRSTDGMACTHEYDRVLAIEYPSISHKSDRSRKLCVASIHPISISSIQLKLSGLPATSATDTYIEIKLRHRHRHTPPSTGKA
mmetsp:Transcript_27756/g.69241  ORF Transcript_27756/g.69241 Transcript_27756/m.69241 type:complete len:96 (+) Transcript_27756:644-931(+)